MQPAEPAQARSFACRGGSRFHLRQCGRLGFLHSGVLTSAACGAYGYDDLDHCVQLVGFNARAKKPYWIVRNSWDTQWGEQGYIYLEYSKNTCGLANEAILAQVE